jgi:hypothetical protein
LTCPYKNNNKFRKKDGRKDEGSLLPDIPGFRSYFLPVSGIARAVAGRRAASSQQQSGKGHLAPPAGSVRGFAGHSGKRN